jgi:hypothetical protein
MAAEEHLGEQFDPFDNPKELERARRAVGERDAGFHAAYTAGIEEGIEQERYRARHERLNQTQERIHPRLTEPKPVRQRTSKPKPNPLKSPGYWAKLARLSKGRRR